MVVAVGDLPPQSTRKPSVISVGLLNWPLQKILYQKVQKEILFTYLCGFVDTQAISWKNVRFSKSAVVDHLILALVGLGFY